MTRVKVANFPKNIFNRMIKNNLKTFCHFCNLNGNYKGESSFFLFLFFFCHVFRQSFNFATLFPKVSSNLELYTVLQGNMWTERRGFKN